MVVFALWLTAPRKTRSEIVKALRTLIGPTLAEPGCLGCHLQQDASNPNFLVFIEEWAQQADLDRHMASHEYRKLLTVMDMSSTQPRISIMTASDAAGFERIKEARKQQHLVEDEQAGREE
jgi:quinol monooxygenase YgiN